MSADARSQLDTHSVYGGSLSAEAILSLGSMEGIYEPVVAAPPSVALPARGVLLPGYAASFAVAAVALSIHYLPFGPFTVAGDTTRHPISTAIIAILVGLAVRNTLALPDSLKIGCKHIIKKLIPGLQASQPTEDEPHDQHPSPRSQRRTEQERRVRNIGGTADRRTRDRRRGNERRATAWWQWRS